MIPNETLVTFFIASILLALAPGPDNIFVLTQSALYGKISGFAVTLGLCTGLLVHTSLVAFGVAVIFQTTPIAFTGLKLIGTCYLLFLAWRAFHATPATINAKPAGRKRSGALYRRGIIMNVTNPKVSIFFLAFLPQFADPDRGSLTLQMILLGGIFIMATIIIFGSISLLAGTVGQWLQRSNRVQIVMNRLAGIVFVGIAFKLITSRL
ncbi:LysE family translocator [bacterium]|nr:LysE family translocator [bacterium]